MCCGFAVNHWAASFGNCWSLWPTDRRRWVTFFARDFFRSVLQSSSAEQELWFQLLWKSGSTDIPPVSAPVHHSLSGEGSHPPLPALSRCCHQERGATCACCWFVSCHSDPQKQRITEYPCLALGSALDWWWAVTAFNSRGLNQPKFYYFFVVWRLLMYQVHSSAGFLYFLRDQQLKLM